MPDVAGQHWRLGARRRAWHDAQGVKIARFGDNMREVAVTEGDKVEAQMQLGYCVNGYGVGDLVQRVNEVCGQRCRQSLSANTRSSTTSLPRCAAGGERHESLRDAARIELGIARVPDRTATSKASPTTFEDLHGLAQLPGLAVAAADGRWLRLWRRRRLEDRRAGARDEGDGGRAAGRHVVHGRLHLSPRARAA